MALIILQYGLPILLGYTFFVGLAGRYNPFSRPAERTERPTWFLGLWTGITVATIAVVGLQVAFRMDLNELSALATPAAFAFAAAMVPGLIGYFLYRSHVKRQLVATNDALEDARISDALQHDNLELDKTLSFDMTASNELDATVPMESADILDIDEQTNIWAQSMDEAELSLDSLDETQLFAIDGIETNEPALRFDDELDMNVDETLSLDEQPADLDAGVPNIAAEETEVEDSFISELADAELQDAVAESVEPAEAMVSESEMLERISAEQDAAAAAKAELQEQLNAQIQVHEEFEAKLASESKAREEFEAKLASESKVREEFEAKLASESKVREEIEAKLASESQVREEFEAKLASESQVREEIEAKLASESQVREEIEAKLASESKVREEFEAKLASESQIREEIEAKLQAELKAREEAEAQLAEEPMVTESEMLARISEEQSLAKSTAAQLQKKLDAELKTRKELERHLRITRNGLGALESESRVHEAQKAAALLEMEQELEEKIKRTSSAEARAEREAEKVAALENEMVQLREDSLKAVNESRLSVEARAKALSTANKATTFARQAMQIRTRLETQLNEAQAEIDNKQSTISSLIKALEKEKSRTQEEVASLAKQLRLHEKQLQARRTLEEVSRSVDNKLSTRLVKKVARARG